MDTQPPPPTTGPDPAPSREQLLSALFANMILQQASLALMFLGKTPHPESGKTQCDLESAQMVIDQIDMLRVKTQGNLNPQEDHLLQESLTNLRLAFVEAVNTPDPGAPPAPAATPPPSPDAAADRSAKKFTKKY